MALDPEGCARLGTGAELGLGLGGGGRSQVLKKDEGVPHFMVGADARC